MLKNIEWGAVAYLTNSEYGRCSEGTCEEVAINSYDVEIDSKTSESEHKTGCGPQSDGSAYGEECTEYNSDLGQSASTTGNIYGIYDMSGGAAEYVMGNSSSASGTYTYNQNGASTSYTYSSDTAKYIDTYAYGTTSNDKSAYNRARLGDATGEVTTTTTNYGWYSDDAKFVYSSRSWFRRSGESMNGTHAGVFGFSNGDGSSYNETSARAALIG